jgi:hypothetical protein
MFRRGLAVGWSNRAINGWLAACIVFGIAVPSLGPRMPGWLGMLFFLFHFGYVAWLPSYRKQTWADRLRGRARAGRCVGCGYDLRAGPEMCPECARRIPRRLRHVRSPAGAAAS